MRTVRVILALILSTQSLWGLAQQKPTPNITYKQTPLNVSEARFMREHSDQGFLCGTHKFGQAGRQCESESASYAGWRPQKTTAYFVANKLIGVFISFPSKSFTEMPDEKERLINAGLEWSLLEGFESRFGEADEIRWPQENPDKTVTQWIKTWKRGGNVLSYLHSLTSIAGKVVEAWDVNVYSVSGQERFNVESRKLHSNRKTDD